MSGKDNLHYLVASLAVETGISPLELIKLDGPMLKMLVRVLEERVKAINDAKRTRAPRRR